MGIYFSVIKLEINDVASCTRPVGAHTSWGQLARTRSSCAVISEPCVHMPTRKAIKSGCNDDREATLIDFHQTRRGRAGKDESTISSSKYRSPELIDECESRRAWVAV